MPELDGIETAIRIKELIKDWNLKPLIVGCSADATESNQQKFKNIRVTYFLNKPINLESISQLHQYLLKNK